MPVVRVREFMRNLLIAGCALSLLTVSAVASAQDSTGGTLPNVTPTDVSVRLGGVFALDGPLRNIQKLWFGAGLEYQFSRELLPNATTYLSADVAVQSGSGKQGNYFPVCINERWYFDQSGHGRRAYFLAGAGVCVMNVTTSNVTGALRTGFGYEFSSNVFAETSLLITGQVDGFQGTSVGVFVGYRF